MSHAFHQTFYLEKFNTIYKEVPTQNNVEQWYTLQIEYQIFFRQSREPKLVCL